LHIAHAKRVAAAGQRPRRRLGSHWLGRGGE
jgi:hypothetical protein